MTTEQQAQESRSPQRRRRNVLPAIFVSLLVLAGLAGALIGLSSGPSATGHPPPVVERAASSPSSHSSPSSSHASSPTTAEPVGSVPFGSNPGNAATAGSGPSAADLTAAHAMLVDEEQHGWDSCYNGLAINWADVYGVTVDNWNGTGRPDPSPCTRHEDRMTTLRFLDGLLLYKADTGTTEFDGEIAAVKAHVLTLFTTANADPRGWAYDTMVQIAGLTGDSAFTAIADAMLHRFATDPADSSRPDWQIEQASALVQSGDPGYVSKGTAELYEAWSADYLPNVGLMNEPGGIKTADQGDIAIALARAGFTTQANQITNGVESPPLGLGERGVR